MNVSCILSDLWPGDWSQFLSELVATIVGIFGPFYLQFLSEQKRKRNNAIKYLCDIKKELIDINRQLTSIKETDIYLNPVKIPVWDSLINTNEIQILSTLNKKKQSNTIYITKQLFQTYDLINEYNLWWNMYTQGAVVGARSQEDLTSIKVFTDKLKKNILCKNPIKEEYHSSIDQALRMIDITLKLYIKENKKGDD